MTAPTGSVSDRAQALVEVLAGPDAVLRPEQLAAIEAIVTGGRRSLVVQRTGFGKSAIYFIATRLLREAGAGPTLVVSAAVPSLDLVSWLALRKSPVIRDASMVVET